MNYGDSVNTVASRVINRVHQLGRSIHQINGPTDTISSNEYRFCMRVGNHNGGCDYHFWLQCNDGQWCDKHGWYQAAVLEGYVNPSTVAWNMNGEDSYYDSATVYFASTFD